MIKNLNNFIKKGFPNRKQEDWKFLDISQIIKKNISNLSYFNDYSQSNKIDPSIFVDGLEHNKIIFINGRVEKIDFNFEDQNKIEIIDETKKDISFDYENSLIDLNSAFTDKVFKILIKKNNINNLYINEFYDWEKMRNLSPTIKALQKKLHEIRLKELEDNEKDSS